MQPSLHRLVVGTSVSLLLASAAYLYVVRGPAILIDLAATGRALFCF
jgi:hypothetical protein